MTEAVDQTCSEHVDRFDCPDALVDYSVKFDEYGLIVHDGGSSMVCIQFCPWCGVKLPDSKRELGFDELARRGFVDPLIQEIPIEFESDKWWRSLGPQ